MSTETKEVEKAVAVHAGEARDANAKVVTPEIGGKTEAEAAAHVAEQKGEAVAAPAETPKEEVKAEEPVVEAPKEEEKSAKAEMKKGLYTVADLAACVDNLNWIVESAEFEAEYEKDGSTVPAQLKAAVAQVGAALVAMTTEEVAEANDGDDVDVELADKPTDLMKAVDLKLDATKQDLLKSLTDAVAGKVGELITPLEDRLKAIESQPVGQAPRRVYTEVEKVADAEPAKDELMQKAADMEANPQNYTPLQRADLAAELLKRSSRQRPIIVT